MNKRGQMSIETIIVIILALLALVIIAASFTGGMKNLWEKISGISDTASGISTSEAVTKCNEICAASKPAFDTTSFLIKDVGSKRCADLTVCAAA